MVVPTHHNKNWKCSSIYGARETDKTWRDTGVIVSYGTQHTVRTWGKPVVVNMRYDSIHYCSIDANCTTCCWLAKTEQDYMENFLQFYVSDKKYILSIMDIDKNNYKSILLFKHKYKCSKIDSHHYNVLTGVFSCLLL